MNRGRKRYWRATHYVIPPPAFPKPPARAFAEPTTFLSKKPVHQTWHGTNVAPSIPTKNRRAIRPDGVLTSPAIAVGTAPQIKVPMKTQRGPNRSQRGPHTTRTRNLREKIRDRSLREGAQRNSYVASSAIMLELATWSCVILRSFLIVRVICVDG
jgi:hypothetical protein